MFAKSLVYFRLPLIVLVLLLLFVFVVICGFLPPLWIRWCSRCVYRMFLRIMGIRVLIEGEPLMMQQTLFLANHSTFVDILILGAYLPIFFVAKSDIRKWPIFGMITARSHAFFVTRDPKQVRDNLLKFQSRLEEGYNYLIFPEGTTSDGCTVLPFRGGLIQGAFNAENRSIIVQPVTVRYERVNTMPASRFFKKWYAWRGDMELMGHLKAIVQVPSVTVVIHVHSPLDPHSFSNRRSFVRACHHKVASALS